MTLAVFYNRLYSPSHAFMRAFLIYSYTPGGHLLWHSFALERYHSPTHMLQYGYIVRANNREVDRERSRWDFRCPVSVMVHLWNQHLWVFFCFLHTVQGADTNWHKACSPPNSYHHCLMIPITHCISDWDHEQKHIPSTFVNVFPIFFFYPITIHNSPQILAGCLSCNPFFDAKN